MTLNLKAILILLIAISYAQAGIAEEIKIKNKTKVFSALKNVSRLIKLIDSSTDVYKTISKGVYGELPTEVVKNSRCIAIFPQTEGDALLLDATQGKGLASCRDISGNWSHLVPLILKQGKNNLQTESKATDLVMFFNTDLAEKALKKGSFILGDEISAVAGNYEKDFDYNNSDIIIYSRTVGIFSGASISGSKILKDDEEGLKFYGKNFNYLGMLENSEKPDLSGYSKKLLELFPVFMPINAFNKS